MKGPLLFFIYKNGLSNNFSSNAKRVTDDTSIFSIVHEVNISANLLRDYVKKS